MRLLLLLLVIAFAAGVQQHHHHHKKQHSHHRGDALLEVGHKAQTHHRAYKVEPCYPPPCPGYDYELEGGSGTTPAGGTGAQGTNGGGTNGGGANGGTNGGGADGGNGGTGSNGGNGNGGNDGGGNGNSGTGSNGEGSPTPLAPENPDNSVPTTPTPAGSSAGASGAAAGGGASGTVVSSSSGPAVWIQVVYPPPDPKAGKSDLESAGCCNPSLAADRAKMLAAQKKIDALTELRAGHIKWLQDAQDAIAKVLRQIAATNETVFELTQDIQLQEQQIEQIQKKIRADILKQNLEAAQEELDKIKENQSSIEAQKSKVQAKADALIEKQHEIMAELKKVPHQNIELVAAKYDPNQQ